MAVVLIGGGSRSGKTRFALARAAEGGSRLAYIATAETLDDEMRARAAAHQAERGQQFATIEAPLELARAIRQQGSEFSAIVVDCLTIWLSNLMLAGRDVEREAELLTDATRNATGEVILVTNEVGAGIVPENELARRFRDRAGWLNQRIAAAADEVYWMVFGCSLKVK